MITILTPTYNRAYILVRLYESLKHQTLNDFEWIIVDDGSEDETEELIKQWKIEDNGFYIRYIKIKNGGKHRALNRAVPISKYEYIFIVDSDDYLVENAVELIHKWIATIAGSERFAGVAGLRAKPDGTIIGQCSIETEFIDATNIQRMKYKLLGDKAEVYRKDLLLKYPFPEFEGEKFIAEGAIWDAIASDGYKIRWFSKPIYIGDYLEDGLTKNDSIDRKIVNFQGYTYVERQNIHTRKFPHNVLAVGRYVDLAKKKGINNKDIIKKLGINKKMLLSGIVFGYIRVMIKKLIKKH